MSVDTKAIIRKGTTLTKIKEVLESHYGEVTVHTTNSEDYFYLSFKDGEDKRCLNVFLQDIAKNDYNIDGVLLSLGRHGNSVKIMKYLLNEFGGYLDENDCDDKGFYSIKLSEFEKGKEFTPMDLFVNKVITYLGYDNLNTVLSLIKEIPEKKVYVVKSKEVRGVVMYYAGCPDENFIKEATRQGRVFTQQDFVKAFNDEEFTFVSKEDYIRII